MSDSDCPRCEKWIADLGETFAAVPLGARVDFECPHCGATIEGFADITYCLLDKNPLPVEEL